MVVSRLTVQVTPTLTVTLPDAVTLGTHTSGNYVAGGAVAGNGLSGLPGAEGATFTVTLQTQLQPKCKHYCI